MFKRIIPAFKFLFTGKYPKHNYLPNFYSNPIPVTETLVSELKRFLKKYYSCHEPLKRVYSEQESRLLNEAVYELEVSLVKYGITLDKE